MGKKARIRDQRRGQANLEAVKEPPPPSSTGQDLTSAALSLTQLREKISQCLQVLETGICDYAMKGIVPPRHSLKKAYAYWNDKANSCIKIMAPLPSTVQKLKTEKVDGPWRLIVILLDALMQLKGATDAMDQIPNIRKSYPELLEGMENTTYVVKMAIQLVLVQILPTEILSYISLRGGGEMDPSRLVLAKLSIYTIYQRAIYVLRQLFQLSRNDIFAKRVFDRDHILQLMSSWLYTSYSTVSVPMTDEKDPQVQANMRMITVGQQLLHRIFHEQIFPKINKADLVNCVFPFTPDDSPLWFQEKCQELSKDLISSPRGGLGSAAKGLTYIFLTQDSFAMSNIEMVLHSQLLDYFSDFEPGTEEFFERMNFFITEISYLIRAFTGKEILQKKHRMEFSMTATALYSALTLTEFDQDYCFRKFWNPLFAPLTNLNVDDDGNESDYEPVTASQVEKILFILDIIVSRPLVTGKIFDIGLFQNCFFMMFKLYTSIVSFISENAEMKWAIADLSGITSKLPGVMAAFMECHHSFTSKKTRISQICFDLLTFPDKRDPTFPLSFQVHCIVDEDLPVNNYILFERMKKPTGTFPNSIRLEAETLSVLLLRNPRISCGTLQGLYAEVMCSEVEECFAIDKNQMTNSEFKPNYDLATPQDLKLFVEMTLLTELGKRKYDILELDNGYSSLAWATYVIRKILGELKESEKNGCDTLDFEFELCLEQALFVYHTLASVLIDPELLTNYENILIDCSNVHWEDLQAFAPVILAVAECKHPAIWNTELQIKAANVYEEIMTGATATDDDEPKKEKKSFYELAIGKLSEPRSSVTQRGLIQLIKCLKLRYVEAMEHVDEILDLLLDLLNHPNIQIYQLCITGLIELGILKHPVVLPGLIEEFANVDVSGDEVSERILNLRTSCGECIGMILQNIENAARNYRDELMTACFLLVTTPNQNMSLKIAAMLLLGSLAETLRYPFLIILTEIWPVIKFVMDIEEDLRLRRASWILLNKTLSVVAPYVGRNYYFSDPEIGVNVKDMRYRLPLYRRYQTDPVMVENIDASLQLITQIRTALIASEEANALA